MVLVIVLPSFETTLRACDAVLSLLLLCAVSEGIGIHLLDGDRVIGRTGYWRFAAIILCDVAGINRCAASLLSGSGHLNPAVRCLPCGTETLDRSGWAELGFLHIQLPRPKRVVSRKRSRLL